MGLFAKLTEKPWLPDPTGVAQLRTGGFAAPNRKVALVVFLAIVAVLFFLFFAAYHMRIELSTDWVPVPEPPLLWANTALLGLGSLAFEWARGRGAAGDVQRLRVAFLVAGALTFAFLVSQVVVWGQLVEQGYLARSNPANGFFYMITGVHGLHLLGGLIAWTRAAFRMFTAADLGDACQSVDLCAMYWHFLLLVWLGMFALLMNS